MQLKQIASVIRNHIVDGLKGVTNEAFSIEQLMQEVVLHTNTIIAQQIKQGLLDPSRVSQRIDGIQIECNDISGNCNIDSLTSAPHFKIPSLAQLVNTDKAISYLGPMDNSLNFRIYYDTDYIYNQYKQVTSKVPYAWVNMAGNGDGTYDVYLFNMGNYNNLKFVSLSAVFENPYDLMNMPYAEQFYTSEFYAPNIVVDQVITDISNKYIQYYRQLNTPVQPNTQEKM